MGKKKGRDGAGVQEGTGSKKEEARSFDFSKCSSRSVRCKMLATAGLSGINALTL
jgi:hypothetical protein